jgi:hypothetical protein
MELAVAFGVGNGDCFGGAQRLDLVVGVAAAQFGVGGDGQVPGSGGGVFPVLPVGHGLGEGVFLLLVEVAQGPVAGGQGVVPLGMVVVAGLAGGLGFGVGADGAQGDVEGAEPGQPQLLSDASAGTGPRAVTAHAGPVWAACWPRRWVRSSIMAAISAR